MENHPDPNVIREVMSRVEALSSQEESTTVHFMEPDFIKKEDCETIACHGGWIGLATLNPQQKDWEMYKTTNKVTLAKIPKHIMEKYYPHRRMVDWFEAGADVFAKMLFHNEKSDRFILIDWAYKNPKLWGNSYGIEMFVENGYKSFGKFRIMNDEGDIVTPQVTIGEIIQHWRGVADRIEARIMVTV